MSSKPTSKEGGARKGGKGSAKNLPEPPKEEDPEPQKEQVSVETEGFGRFEYMNGSVYEGNWKLIEGVKMKHGEGNLTHFGSMAREFGNESYSGSWANDKMEGYGVYKYTSGAIYYGDWKSNKQEGKGCYEFPDGCVYDGEWNNHQMNGEGTFIDKNGVKWEGEFVEGVFQSKMQKQLKMEKILKKKEQEIKDSVLNCLDRFISTFASSDKKSYKANLTPFFAIQDEIKLYVKEPYPKYEDKQPAQWEEAFGELKSAGFLNILRNNMQAKVMDHDNIIIPQFIGNGQIVEFIKENEAKYIQAAFCNLFESNWVLVFFSEVPK